MTDRDALRAALDGMPHHFAIGTRDGNDYDPDDLQCAACMEDWPCPDSRLISASRAALAQPAEPSPIFAAEYARLVDAKLEAER